MTNDLTLTEAGIIAHVTATALRVAIHDGRLTGTKRGNLWFVTRDELDRYIRDRKTWNRPREDTSVDQQDRSGRAQATIR